MVRAHSHGGVPGGSTAAAAALALPPHSHQPPQPHQHMRAAVRAASEVTLGATRRQRAQSGPERPGHELLGALPPTPGRAQLRRASGTMAIAPKHKMMSAEDWCDVTDD